MHPLRLAAAAAALAAVAGCAAAPDATPQPPPPKLAKVVPANYTVTAQRSMPLIPHAAAEAVVVTSSGPGRAGHLVSGGTGDVQVLTYDRATGRWNIALDAAHAVPSVDVTSPPQPLLDQRSILEDVHAAPVWFTGQPAPDLLIYGMDTTANHPYGDAALVQFRTGTADVVWRTSFQNMPMPQIVGFGHQQRLRLHADYLTRFTGACCPARQFTQVVAGTRQGVRVVTDDRPYLGVWVEPSQMVAKAALVVGVDPDSPASGILQPGDLLLGVGDTGLGARAARGIASQEAEVARHHAGDTVAVRLLRDRQVRSVDVKLGSQTDDSYVVEAGHPMGIFGAGFERGTLLITAVSAGPAQNVGLQPGDFLVAVNGQQISTLDELRVQLWAHAGIPMRVAYRNPFGDQTSTWVTPTAATESDTIALPARM